MKDNIDKIDEQIKSIKEAEKNHEEDHQVIVDKKYAYDNVPDGTVVSTDTKKIKKLEELKEDVVAEDDPTKKIKTIEEKPKVEEKKEEEPKKEPKKKKNIILYCILGAIILILLVILLFLLLPKKDKNKEPVKEEDILTLEEQEEIFQKYGDLVQKTIKDYIENKKVHLSYEEVTQIIHYDYDIECLDHEVYKDGSIYLNRCELNNIEIDSSYGTKQENNTRVIPEGSLKIYVPKKGGKASFVEPIPEELDLYDIYALNLEGECYSPFFLDAEKSEYIALVVYNREKRENKELVVNYKNGEKILSNISYITAHPIEKGKKFDADYIVLEEEINNQKIYSVYNIKNGTKVPNTESLFVGKPYQAAYRVPPNVSFQVSSLGTNIILGYRDNGEEKGYGVFNYTTGETIIPFRNYVVKDRGDYIWCFSIYDEGITYIYDSDGKRYLEDKYDRVLGMLSKNYILVEKSKDILLVNFQGDVLYNYGEVKLGNYNSSSTRIITNPQSYEATYGASFKYYRTAEEDLAYSKDESCINFIYYENSKKGEIKATYCSDAD